MYLGMKWNFTLETSTAKDVPQLFRDKFISYGYRLPNQPWTYYIGSLFQAHNETANVWTHLVACLIFAYHTACAGRELDFWEDSTTWPILLLCTSVVSYGFLSAMAHLLHSKSALVHFTCFQIDYIGVSVNAFCSGCAYYALSGRHEYYDVMPPEVFLPVNAMLSILICLCCGMSRLKLEDPNGFQRFALLVVSNGITTFWASSAVFHRVFQCHFLDPEGNASDVHAYWRCIVLFAVAAMMFVSGFPERMSPGTFDFIGQGHQLFHLTMALTSFAQIKLALMEFHSRPKDLMDRMYLPSRNMIGYLVFVMATNIMFVVLTHSHRKQVAKLHEKSTETCRFTCNGGKQD